MPFMPGAMRHCHGRSHSPLHEPFSSRRLAFGMDWKQMPWQLSMPFSIVSYATAMPARGNMRRHRIWHSHDTMWEAPSTITYGQYRCVPSTAAWLHRWLADPVMKGRAPKIAAEVGDFPGNQVAISDGVDEAMRQIVPRKIWAGRSRLDSRINDSSLLELIGEPCQHMQAEWMNSHRIPHSHLLS